MIKVSYERRVGVVWLLYNMCQVMLSFVHKEGSTQLGYRWYKYQRPCKLWTSTRMYDMFTLYYIKPIDYSGIIQVIVCVLFS